MLSNNCIEVLLNINTELEPDRLTLARSTSRQGVFTLSNLYQQADLASYKHKHSLSLLQAQGRKLELQINQGNARNRRKIHYSNSLAKDDKNQLYDKSNII